MSGDPAPKIHLFKAAFSDGAAFAVALSTATVRQSALNIASRGIPVFPCQPNKRPYPGSRGFNDATTDLKIIDGWWTERPDALIGMPTGELSGIAVLDLDVKNDKDGIAAVPDWETRSNTIARTRSGGIHLYFKNDNRVRSQVEKIAPGVDTRGNGGYVIIPPSAGYEFIKGNLSDLSTLLPWPEDMFPPEREVAEPTRTTQDVPTISDRDKARIAAALDVIPSDTNYENWFQIGCALRKELGDGGFDLFDKWSAKSEKQYDKRECIKQWDGCAQIEKFNVGTIFHHADASSPTWRADFEAKNAKPLILTSAEFVSGFIPPDYLIDGLLQRRFIYSMTAPTNTGKTVIALRLGAHVAQGLPLAGHAIDQGKVLFFAGENPDDVRMRWIKLCEEMKVEPNGAPMHFVAGAVPLSKVRTRINAEAKIHGPFALVIVDTLAAYFEGDEENSNTQMGANARMLRTLVEVDGGPTVIVTCHPTKNPNVENLLPRGGGAFLAEVDGNLVCLKKDGGIVDLHWQGKFRGPDFEPVPFKIDAGTTDSLKDSKGRRIWTVTARPISKDERAASEASGSQKRNHLLEAMRHHPGASLAELARALGWNTKDGDPNKTAVNRLMAELSGRGLVKKVGDRWSLTKAGKSYAPDEGGPF